MQERQKAANLIADVVIAAAMQTLGWHWKDAVSLYKSITHAIHTRRICRVGVDRTWHINWGITRWKDEPLKDRGFFEGPVPFSPTR